MLVAIFNIVISIFIILIIVWLLPVTKVYLTKEDFKLTIPLWFNRVRLEYIIGITEDSTAEYISTDLILYL